MNKIEITVLSARVLDALSGRGLKAKTVHEFERYGTRRIVKHCLGKGQILYAIADYILHARPKCKSEYIFLRVLRPYTKIGSMWTVIAKYAHIALGKDRKMNGPHAFRRGMGRQLLEANIPAPLICDILGHSSSVSLRQYTASSLEKLKVCAGTISAIPIAQEALL